MTPTKRIRIEPPPKKKARKYDRIAYLPGQEFGAWLAEFGKVYGIPRSEAAKRLAIMAVKGFLPEPHYDLLDKLHKVYVKKYGPRHESFMLTCTVARNSLDKKFEEVRDLFEGGFRPNEVTDLLAAVLEVYRTGRPTDLVLRRVETTVMDDDSNEDDADPSGH